MVAHYQRAIWLDPTGLAPRRQLAHSLSMAGRVEAALLPFAMYALSTEQIKMGNPVYFAMRIPAGVFHHTLNLIAPILPLRPRHLPLHRKPLGYW
jgi:hypothetical protein